MQGSIELPLLGRLLVVLTLVFSNGLFVAAEFSLVAMRRSRVHQWSQEGHPLASAVQRALNSLDLYLAATQLGITMSSLALGWIGEPFLAALVAPALSALPRTLALVGAHGLATLIAFAAITTLHIVLGELVPKSFALQRTEQAALGTVPILELFLLIFRPAVVLLNYLAVPVVWLLGLSPTTGASSVHSIEELRLLVGSAHAAGLLGTTQEEMFARVLRFGSRRVGELMTRRAAIEWLDASDSPAVFQRKIIESTHSYLPLCRGGLDNIVGVVKMKDLLQSHARGEPMDPSRVVRSPVIVPEYATTARLLELFKGARARLALVIDEYGVVEGLATLADISEAILGDVPALGESDDVQVVRRDDGSWLLSGRLSIDEFKDLFVLRSLPGEGRHYHTLAGFLMMQMGRIPNEGDRFTWGPLHFEIVDMDDHRIDKVIARSRHRTEDGRSVPR